MRFSQLTLLLFTASCAGQAVRGDAELQEMRGELAAQSAQFAAQQRRIEELEVKLAAVRARPEGQPGQKTPAPEKPLLNEDKPAAAAPKDPRPQLKTVMLGGRRKKRDFNPVERAPAIPASIEMKEPDEAALERLQAAAVDPGIRDELGADHAFAQAVGKLNNGKLQDAEAELLAFAGQHPRHTAADNALYLAGMIREHNGDCAGAVGLFERVPLSYPAGDALLPALLEKGRCLSKLRRKDEARALFARIVKDHPDGIESGTARQLLKDLDYTESGRH